MIDIKEKRKRRSTTIKARMSILFGIILLGLLILNGLTVLQTNIVNNQLEDLSKANLPLFQSMDNIKILEMEQESIMLKTVAGVAIAGQMGDQIKGAIDDNVEGEITLANENVIKEYEIAKVYAQEAINRSEKFGDRDIIDEYNMIYDHLVSLEKTHTEMNDSLADYITVIINNPNAQQLMRGREILDVDAVVIKDDLETFVAHVQQLVNDNVENIHQVQETSRNMIVGVITILSIIVIIIFVLVNKIVLKPLIEFRKEMEEISTGDFTVIIPEKLINRKDEIGDLAKALKALKVNISELLTKVKKASQSVATSSTSLADVTEQSSYAMNEITEAMTQIADTSQEQTDESATVVIKRNDLGEQIQDSETQI